MFVLSSLALVRFVLHAERTGSTRWESCFVASRVISQQRKMHFPRRLGRAQAHEKHHQCMLVGTAWHCLASLHQTWTNALSFLGKLLLHTLTTVITLATRNLHYCGTSLGSSHSYCKLLPSEPQSSISACPSCSHFHLPKHGFNTSTCIYLHHAKVC